VPIHSLSSVLCFGHTMVTPGLMDLCAQKGVLLTFFSQSGRFIARVHGPVSGNVLLRRQQYRAADDPLVSAQIASWFVLGKIANARNVLQRGARESADPATTPLNTAVKHLGRIFPRLLTLEDVDSVRGWEGDASRAYFAAFDHLITADKANFFFNQRSRRPPLDNVNTLLSFLYTLLVSECVAALEGVGLDPSVGFLHRDRPGRPSLALDLMEELRPMLADRLALSLINRRQAGASGFRRTESGAVLMGDDLRKQVLQAWQKRKQEEIVHPFLGEKVMVGLLPHIQALLLSRYLRGDLDAYPAMVWK
jgi:CRISPR-associated protein Cas1